MSGRIRTIKPEWLEDELLATSSPQARVLSIALLLLADDYGNGRANHGMLASRVFPSSDDSPEGLMRSSRDLHEGLRDLIRIRFCALYEVGGQTYFAIRNWDKHQKVQHRGKALVPARPETLFSEVENAPPPPSGESHEPLMRPSGESHESLTPDLRPTTNDQRPTTPTRERAREQSKPREPDRSGRAPPGAVALAVRAERYLRDEQGGRLQHGPAEDWPEVREVLAAFRAAWPAAAAPVVRGGLKDPRLRVVLERLSEGYEPAVLARAVRASAADEHYQRHPRMQALHVILADAARVDGWLASTAPPTRAEPRPDAAELARRRAAREAADAGERERIRREKELRRAREEELLREREASS